MLRFKLTLLLALAVFSATQAQQTVVEIVHYLDSVLQKRIPPTLTVREDVGWVDIEIYRDIYGRELSSDEQRQFKIKLTPSTTPSCKLPLSGIYKVEPKNKPSSLRLQFGVEGMDVPIEKKLELEHTFFWLQVLPESGISGGAVLWDNTAISILVKLAVTSKLVDSTKLPMSVSEWRSVLAKLDESSFFRTQLAGLRLSELPSAHPLIPDLIQKFNEQADTLLKAQLPIPETETSATATGSDYFLLQDIADHYRTPDIANATADLGLAGDRIRTNRQGEGLSTAALATGLTDFVIERAKEEFSVAFLERMKNYMSDSDGKLKELTILFPQTAAFFTGKSSVSNYKNLLPTLRDFFLHDLQTLGFQVHRLLELEPYNHLKNTGEVYNLALFYDVASMAYQGIALDTLLDNVYLRLSQREQQLFLQGNRDLAEESTAQDTLKILQNMLTALSADLDTLSKKTLSKSLDLEGGKFFVALEKVAEEEYKKIYRSYLESVAPYEARMWPWLAKDRHEQLLNIPKQLQGQTYYRQILSYPKLEQYTQYFGTKPDSIQLIASGIELSKKLVSPPLGEVPISTFFVNYYRYLSGVEQTVVEKIALFKKLSEDSLKSYEARLNEARATLHTQLEKEVVFWEKGNHPFLEYDLSALKFLSGALKSDNDPSWDTPTELSGKSKYTALEDSEARLNQVRIWAKERLDSVEAHTGIKSMLLPTLLSQLKPASPESAVPIDPNEEARIQRILSRSDSLARLLNQMDTTYIGALTKSRNQSLLLSTVVEMSANLLSCLRTSAAGEPATYLSPNQFWALMREERSRDLFLGVIEQRLQQVSQKSQLSARNISAATARLVDLTFQAIQLRDSLQARSQSKLQFSDYLPFARLGMEAISIFIQYPVFGSETSVQPIEHFPLVANQAVTLFEDTDATRYGNAIQALVELFRLVSSTSTEATTRWDNVRNDILLYGSFMANVANARTADDIKGALLAAALPPGSSRVKREVPFNIGLNAYLGVMLGREALNNSSAVRPTACTAGLSLPIGISTSWKFKQTHETSFSVLLSALDLGAVAAFRLGDPDAELLPDIKWDNFVAPGAFAFINFPRSPFSAGFGSQYGPRTRSITTQNGIETRSAAWRLLLFAGMDIPVFSFATQRSKWKKD